MLSPVLQTEEAADVQVGRRSRGALRRGGSRASGGSTLDVLRATSGPPAAAGDAASTSTSGSRRTSLFDPTRSGEGVLARLRAQARGASPLTAALSGAAGASAPAAPAADQPALAAAAAPAGTPATEGEGEAAAPAESDQRRLDLAAASRAALRTALRRADGQARLLQAQASPWRTNLGFGLRPATDENRFGGGLSLFGGGDSLFA